MIGTLSGEITARDDNVLVIDVNGIGYEVVVPETTARDIGIPGTRVKVFTHLTVRDDGLSLYGFSTRQEREMFRMLIAVNRVGPQTALAILSQIRIDDLALAILNEDEKVLTRISGIGQKSAKRLILELKDTIKARRGLIAGTTGTGMVQADAVAALVSLGFREREAATAVAAAVKEGRAATTENLVRSALQFLREGL